MLPWVRIVFDQVAANSESDPRTPGPFSTMSEEHDRMAETDNTTVIAAGTQIRGEMAFEHAARDLAELLLEDVVRELYTGYAVPPPP